VRYKQAPPVRVSRSGGSQRESNGEHAEVTKRSPTKEGRQGTGKEVQDRGKREREKIIIIIIIIIIINRERVRDESKMERGKHK
jgi:hypothetical protein